jgi:hypothetical protein
VTPPVPPTPEEPDFEHAASGKDSVTPRRAIRDQIRERCMSNLPLPQAQR